MKRLKRKIISDEQCIVVLDTSPVRNIAYASETPAWVATFVEMSQAGYSFSLADGSVAELLAAYVREAISEAELARIVGAIEPFLNPDMPTLPGKRDLMGMIGELDDLTWSEAETVAYSKAAWAVLKSPSSLTCRQRLRLVKALQADREDWIESFAVYDRAHAEWLEREPDGETKYPLHEHRHVVLDDALADIATYSRTSPPSLAERKDLEMRYVFRQWVRYRQEKDGYDPSSPKKRNDGIDLDLYRYLMLPAFVVAGEGGFHERIADIKSRQRGWFWRPQSLADAWARGDRPRPTWAAPVGEEPEG